MNLDLIFAQQAVEHDFFQTPAYQPQTVAFAALAAVVGGIICFVLMNVPANLRKYVIGAVTFSTGLFYVLLFLWPKNVAFKPGQMARGPIEQFAEGLQETLPRISDVAQIMTSFLLLLGIISLLRMHVSKATKNNSDAFFSRVLLVSMAAMVVVGYVDFFQTTFNDPKSLLLDKANWGPFQYGNDFLFDGLYQQMESAMFSIIAFYILSAAYRAFRIRSIESSVLMGSALILMLSLMGAITTVWGQGIEHVAAQTHNTFILNFRIDVVASWVKTYLQTPSIRAIEFGIGLGALAMGLRIWLGLEKGGGGA